MLQYLPIFMYGIISNFGRSLWRPFFGLISTWLLAAQLIYWRSFVDLSGSFWNALALSSANMLPFISWSRSVRDRDMEPLFGKQLEIHWMVEVAAFGEGLFSLIFIFLIGMALRNKVRL